MTFTLTDCGTTQCSYGVRIANLNSGSTTNPQLCYLSKISVDHSKTIGVSFEAGTSMSLRDSFVTATGAQSTANYAVWVDPYFGGQLDIQNNDIVSNGAGGIGIARNDVIVQGNRIFANATGNPEHGGFGLSGINVLSTVTGGLQIQNNQIGQPVPGSNPTQLYGIDLSAVGSGTDWITITGNVLGGNINGSPVVVNGGINLPSPRINLGVHTRITDNTGFNPVDPISFPPPAVPTSDTDLQNTYFADAMVTVIPGDATVTKAEITYPGETTRRIPVLGSFTGTGRVPIFVPCGTLVRLEYSGGTPTWLWFPT